jgi:hypothetical protein
MKYSDLGIDRNGYHSRVLTALESRFLGILIDHQGVKRSISGDALALCLDLVERGQELPDVDERESAADIYRENFPGELSKKKRVVRYLQNHLLFEHDHLPVLSSAGSGGGYWMAEGAAEARAFFDTFRGRAMTGLKKASRGKAAIMADVMTQLAFEFENEPVIKQTGIIAPRAGVPAPIAVVDAMLEKMSRDPEKFADGLRKIGRKYGGVLLDKKQIAAMQAKVTELQNVLTGLTG